MTEQQVPSANNTIKTEDTIQFSDLKLQPKLLQAIERQGYQHPSPIQAQGIPAVLSGHDVMAAAQTGTGKTAGFTLPMLEILSKGQRARGNNVRALVLAPTRELAAQVGASVATYGKELALSYCVAFGGVKINPQMMQLRRGADILVATPGRLMDLYQQNAIKFEQLEMLVLDEADRMLDMGFIHDIRRIIKLLPPKRQNLLYSATFSDEIRELAKTIVQQPLEISVVPANTTAKTIEQWVYPVDKSRKTALLSHLIKENDWQQVLVFSRTKHGANRIATNLEKRGIHSAAIHGNKSQGARTKALAGFKDGSIKVLVATDIAARGIDIDQLPCVINFDLPNVAEDYVHRIGRTGRAGASGLAISFVTADEAKDLNGIENLIQELLPRQTIAGFEPTNEVAPSTLRAPKKPKKPKKPKAAKAEQPGNTAKRAVKKKPSHVKKAASAPQQGKALQQGKEQGGANKPKGRDSDSPQAKGPARRNNRWKTRRAKTGSS
nr:DEAD/DEAH box helicase [Pseudoalteromonas sp. CNAT2-18.1]